MNLLLPKQNLVRDRAWLDHLREGPCIVTGFEESCDPAHIRWGADAGTSRKPSDSRAVPLLPGLHSLQHQIGEVVFWKKMARERDGFLMRVLIELAEARYREWDNDSI